MVEIPNYKKADCCNTCSSYKLNKYSIHYCRIYLQKVRPDYICDMHEPNRK